MREDKNCVLDDNLTFAIYIYQMTFVKYRNKIHTRKKKSTKRSSFKSKRMQNLPRPCIKRKQTI